MSALSTMNENLNEDKASKLYYREKLLSQSPQMNVQYCMEVNTGWSPLPTVTQMKNYAAEETISEAPVAYWLEQISKISTMASFLCVIDCTILPLLTVVFPLLGIATSSLFDSEWLDHIGHLAALYFVMPVGALAATTNFLSHRKVSLLSMSFLGLLSVYSANGHDGPILSLIPHAIAHELHCGGALHRIVNISGCGLLLGSNFLSRKYSSLEHIHGPNCIHAIYFRIKKFKAKHL